MEYSGDRKHYRELGLLEEQEPWEGDIKEEYGSFSFEREYAKEYLDEDLLWVPSARAFQPWSTFIDEDGDRNTESFYSAFQFYSLHRLIERTGVEIRSEWLEYPHYKKMIFERTEEVIGEQLRAGAKGDLPLLCQIISNRYFPATQSDRRTLTVSTSVRPGKKWDWFEYRRNWNPEAIREALGISAEELRTLHETLLQEAREIDPLEHWYEIVSFVAPEQRKRLKHKAALAQAMYAQEMMLRLFYNDLTGEKLLPPDESWDWSREAYYGRDAIENLVDLFRVAREQVPSQS